MTTVKALFVSNKKNEALFVWYVLVLYPQTFCKFDKFIAQVVLVSDKTSINTFTVADSGIVIQKL